MTVSLSSLRVASDLDASGYARGAKQIDAANASMAASSRSVGATVIDMTGRISRSGDALSQLERKYVAGARQAQAFEAGLRRLGGVVDKDASQLQRAVSVLAGMQQQFGMTANAAELAGRGWAGAAKIADALAASTDNLALSQMELAVRADELRRQFDTGYASAQRMDAALADLAEAERLGVQITGGYSAALDSLIQKYDATAQAARRLADEQAELIRRGRAEQDVQNGQQRWNDYAGVREIPTGGARNSAAVFEAAAREADEMARSVATLRARIDPLRAAQQQLNAELVQYQSFAARGAISSVELAKAEDLARQKYEATANIIRQHSGAVEVGAHHAANLAAQFQDIAVSAQMGMSPLQVALQQGTQISAVLGPMGAAGSVRALGAAFLGLINPVSLMTIGLVAAATGAIQYFARMRGDTRSANDVLSDHEKRIRALKDAYGDAAKGVEAYAAQSRTIEAFLARASAGEMQVKLRAEAQSAGDAIADLFGANRGIFSSSAFARRDSPFFDAVGRGLENIRANAENGRPAIGAFREELVRLANENPSPEVDKFVASVLSATDSASKLERALTPTTGAIAAMGSAAANSLINVTTFADALEKLGAQVPNIAKAQTAAATMRENVNLYQQALDDLDRQMAQGSIRNEDAYFSKRKQIADMLRKAQEEASGLGEATRDLEKRERSAYVDALVPREAAAARIRDRYAEYAKTLKAAGASEEELNRNTAAMNKELANSSHHFDEVEAKAKSASNSYKELVRNAGSRLDQMRLELELTGKAGASAEELRYRQQLLSDAMADNISLTPKQRTEIDALAQAYGRLSEQINVARALDDLNFEREQIGRTREEQQVYSEIRQLGLDINSAAGQQVANAIRMNAAIEKQRDMWTDIASTVAGIFSQPLKDVDDLFSRLAAGFAKMGEQNIENLFQGLMGGTSGKASSASGAASGLNLGGLFAKAGEAFSSVFTDRKVVAAQNKAVTTMAQSISVKPLTNTMSELAAGIRQTALDLGVSARDIGAIVGYETGGTFDKWQKGPTTKWGQHRGFIQMGEPQRAQYGVTADTSIADQFKAITRYMIDRGVKPGMGLADLYSAVNAGYVRLYDRVDQGTTVMQKVRNEIPKQFAKVDKILGSASDMTSAVAAGTKDGIKAVAIAGGGAGAGAGASGAGGAAGGAASAAGNGMSFGDVANVALSGLGMGYQSQSAGMGALGGFLSGLSTGNPVAAVIGGIAGAIGGLFGARSKRKQEEKQARQQLDQNRTAIAQLFALGEGRGIGSATQSYNEFYDKTAQLDEVAQKAGDDELVQKLRNNVNKFFVVLEKDFVGKLPGVMEAYSSGQGSNSPFMQGVSAMEQLREELKNFIADAKDFGELQLKHNRDLTPEQLAQRVADAERASQQMVLSSIGGVRELGEMEKQVLAVHGATATAVPALEQFGMSADAAAKAVDGMLNVALAKLKDKYIGGLVASINELSGLGYLNSIMDAQITYQQRLADAAQIGEDGSLAIRELSLSIGEIVRQAGLGSEQLSMLAGAFPQLQFVLNGVSTSTMTVAEATSQLQAAYEKEASALSDTISAAKQGISAIDAFRKAMKLGSSSPLSPFDKVTEAMKQLRDTADKAIAGDPEATGKVTQIGQSALDEARAYYASSTDYFEIWTEVEAIMARVQGATEGQLTKAEQQKAALDASVSGILKVNDSVVSVRDAIENFNQAQKANTDLLATQLALIGKAGTASIDAAYKANLDRAPDSGGGAYWQGQINSGKTVDQVVDAIANSREAQINALYKQVFGRPLDNESRAYWVNSGKSMEQIAADLNYAKTQGAYRNGGIVGRFAAGGMVGNGLYDVDSVRARYAGGGDIMLAGGEYVNPARSVNSRTFPTLDYIRQTGNVPGNDNSAVIAELRALRQTVEALSAQNAALAAALAANAKQQSRTAEKTVAILGDVSSELKLVTSR